MEERMCEVRNVYDKNKTVLVKKVYFLSVEEANKYNNSNVLINLDKCKYLELLEENDSLLRPYIVVGGDLV